MTTRMDRARCLASWMCTAYCRNRGGLRTPRLKVPPRSQRCYREQARLNNFATHLRKARPGGGQAGGGLTSFAVWSAAATRHHPVDNLVGIGDVAGLAMHAVREINLQLHRAAGFFCHLVHCRRTKILAGVAILFDTFRDANICIEDMQVARLIFVVSRTGMIDVGKPVE